MYFYQDIVLPCIADQYFLKAYFLGCERKKLPYKHLGSNNSSENCNFNIYKREVISINSSLNGQQDSPFLYSQNGGTHNKQHCVKSVRIWNFSGPYSAQMRENADQENSEYGHFSHRATVRNKQENLPVPFGQSDHDYCNIPTKQIECENRLGVEGCRDKIKVGTST